MTDAERAVYAFLDETGIAYHSLSHARVSAIEDCLPIAERLGGVVPRNYFLAPRNQSEFYLLLAHPDSVFRTSSVSRQAGASRLMFAPEDALSRLLHTHPGAVSPLGLMFESAKDVRLLADRRLVVCGGGISAVLEKSEAEREALRYAEEMDAKLMQMREALRSGARLEAVN